jgi:hypothetical protein
VKDINENCSGNLTCFVAAKSGYLRRNGALHLQLNQIAQWDPIWTVLTSQNLKNPPEESEILQYIFYFVQRDNLRARATNTKKEIKKKSLPGVFFFN